MALDQFSSILFGFSDEFRFLPFRSMLQDVRLVDLVSDGGGL